MLLWTQCAPRGCQTSDWRAGRCRRTRIRISYRAGQSSVRRRGEFAQLNHTDIPPLLAGRKQALRVCLPSCLSVRRAGVFLTQFITTGCKLCVAVFIAVACPNRSSLLCCVWFCCYFRLCTFVVGVVAAFVAILMCLSTSCFLPCYCCCCVVSVAAIARARFPSCKRNCSVCSPHCLSVRFCQSVCLSIWFAFGMFCWQ